MKYPDARRFFRGPACPWRPYCRYPKLPTQDLTWWELTNDYRPPVPFWRQDPPY